MSIIASWGLQTPVQPRFGARAIVDRGSVNLLWDRSGVYGEADELWLTEIDRVLPHFIDQLSIMFKRGKLLTDQDNLVKLEQTGWICLANPRASYGYLYLDIAKSEGSRQTTDGPQNKTERVGITPTLSLSFFYFFPYLLLAGYAPFATPRLSNSETNLILFLPHFFHS